MIKKYLNKSGKRSICVCQNCNTEFETLDIKIRDGKEKFCNKNCYNDFRSKNKLNEKERNIFYQKKNKYGLSEDEYKNLFIIQNNKCMICDNPFNKNRKANVDHDHITKKVRGLLCSKCNTLLGMVNDNIEILYKSIDYLKKHNL